MQASLTANVFKRALRKAGRFIGFLEQFVQQSQRRNPRRRRFRLAVVDMEHAPNEVPLLVNQLQAMTGGTAAPVVRPGLE